MAVYQIYLVKLGDSIGLTDKQQSTVKKKIEKLYNRVIEEGKVKGYASSNVNWSTNCPTVKPSELLVYIMRNDIYSVVQGYMEKADKKHQIKFQPKTTGWTSWAAGKTISEVYVQGCASDLDVIAKTVFHESYHYKTQWKESRVHQRGGLAAASISADTPLTKTNINDMATHLTKAITPVLDGCQIYAHLKSGILSMQHPDDHFHRAVATYQGSVRGGTHVPVSPTEISTIGSRSGLT